MTAQRTLLTREVLRSAFVREVERISGQNANVCYQCMKCSTGCPVSAYMDLQPAQVVHALRLGQEELVMRSATPWICASCQTCTTRCPQELDIAGLMDAVRIVAWRRGAPAPLADVKEFFKAALWSIRTNGRMHEVGMIMRLKLATLQLMKDAGLGLKMWRKGKLKLLPDRSCASQAEGIFRRVSQIEAEKER